MKNKYLIWASLAMAALLSAGCVKEKNYDEIRVPGEPIRFSAETGFENGDGTRTQYSGVLSGTTTVYERIDWVKNDPMKIIYVQGSAESFANYKVDSFSSSEEPNSYAQVSVDGADELVWGAGSGTNKFYAMYPTAAKNAYASLVNTGSSIRATGTLLPTQDVDASKTQSITVNGDTWTRYQPNMDYNYLLAYADDATGITGTSVRLPFRPAVTAFEFRFQLQSGDVVRKVTKFELSSSSCALTGEFKIDITGGNEKGATWGTPNVPARNSANSVITVNFPSGGVALPSEGYLDFTVFALPSDLTDLTMTLTYEGGKHAVLPLNIKSTGAPYQFAGARKYVITNSNVPGTQVWHYVIEPIDDITFVGHTPVFPIGYNVKSYKWSDREGQGVKYPVKWKTQYFDGTNWVDVPSTGAITGSDYSVESGAVTGNGVSTSTYAAGEDRNARLSGNSTPDSGAYGPSAQDIIDDLAARAAKSDYDLSMHDVFGNTHAQTTANSYVVTAPGTYKFPVVYGNAITNGRDNVEAYYPMIDGNDVGAPGVVSQLYSTVYAPNRNRNTFRYLGRFRSADNNPISKPNIVEDFEFWESETVKYQGPAAAGQYTPGNLDAAIVWQNSMELPGETTGHAIVQESSVSYANGYITFTITPEDIRPGNVVIAFRGTVGTKIPAKSILWSWQIWVTANDLTPVELPNGALMPYNLGYIDSTGGGYVSYPNREIQFRIVQSDPDDTAADAQEDFLVEQRGDGTTWDASVGFNVYYQWGRKDPMIPAKDYGSTTKYHPLAGNREVYPDANYVPGTGYTVNVQGNALPGGYFNSSGNTAPDFANGIQKPYNAFLNTHNSGWVGGFDNGYYRNLSGWVSQYGSEAYRLNSSIPVNLWNNGMYTTMDGTDNKWKTVYDPCPPGFCVPTIGVLANFTNATAIGEPTSDGRYFSTQSGGRIFFPFSGLRVFYNNNDGTAVIWAEQVRKGGYYWTDSTLGNVCETNTENSYSKLFSFGRSAVNAILPITVNLDLNMRGVTDCTRGSSMAIRPMVDPQYYPEF